MQDQEHKTISYNDKIDVFIWLLNTQNMSIGIATSI